MKAATTSPATPTQSDTLRVPGASLYYEIRGSGGPLVVLHAAPMDARSFEPLADLLASDHTVLTTDPRGIGRSTVEDVSATSTPEQRADDVARLIEHVGAGSATVFGSSGGAVSALALTARRPDLLSGVIAHEPPLAVLVDDTEQIRTATTDMIATYRRGDRRGYWTKFLQIAAIELPEDLFQMFFGQTPTGRDAEDERFSVEQMEMATTFWDPPLDALRADGVPVVVGIGVESTGQLCDRTSRALAGFLGIEPTSFPGDHIGFTAEPDAFATTLRGALATCAS